MSKTIISLLLFFSISSTLGICAQQEQSSSQHAKITLQLKWRHAFQFAGFYAAELKGYYTEAGLDVSLIERSTKFTPLDALLEGKTDYALLNGSTLLMSHLQGNPVKALAVIFQHSPNIILSRKDSQIRTPADLVGKKVMLSKRLATMELKAMLTHEGVKPDSIERIRPTLQLKELMEGRVDAINAYITSGPYELMQRGIESNYLQPINYGVDFYGDTLATTNHEISNHPERVQAFTLASLKGWQYAFAHQDEIIDYILTLPGVQERNITGASLRNEAMEMEKLIHPDLVEIGHINPGRFTHMADTFVDLGIIDPGFSLDEFIYSPEHRPRSKWLTPLIISSSLLLVIGAIGWLINQQLTKTVAERTRKYKESEQRFHDLVTLLPEMVWEADLTGKITYFNQAALARFRQATPRPGEDVYCLDMLIPEDREAASMSLKGAAEGEQTHLNEYTAIAEDGDTFPVWIRSSPIIKEGIVTGLRGIIIDISERRRLEEQLNQAQKMESIGTLAGGIAHDFNNILTAILGYTELAGLHMGNEQQVKNDLKHIHTGAIRARDLVAQILAFSRKSDQVVSTVIPALIVKEALKLLRSSTPSTVEFKQHIDSSSKIQIDSTQFHQIMMNICTNAIQALEPKGGLLQVSLSDIQFHKESNPPPLPGLLPGSYICLEITDNGTGMEEKTCEKIFEPYFTTKEVGKGTGLGLAVVHGIVKKCTGDIVVTSTLGEGTCFRIYLPIKEQDDVTGELSIPGEQTLKSQFQGRGERIMLIDDEEELIVMMGDLLVHSGYRVCTYTDSEQALLHFTKNPQAYDLILTDMTMPRLTGLELSEQCLRLKSDQPIILMTGFSEQVDQDKARKAGIRCFIQKPPETAFLLQSIRELLDANAQPNT